MYACLSHEATAKRKESGCGENLRAEMASAGGSEMGNRAAVNVSGGRRSKRADLLDMLRRDTHRTHELMATDHGRTAEANVVGEGNNVKDTAGPHRLWNLHDSASQRPVAAS
jgi:hypothetical protein